MYITLDTCLNYYAQTKAPSASVGQTMNSNICCQPEANEQILFSVLCSQALLLILTNALNYSLT